MRYSLTCCGVVPGTSLAMLSQTRGLEEWNSEEWNSEEFMNVRSIRSSATERDAGTPLPREYDIFQVRIVTAS